MRHRVRQMQRWAGDGRGDRNTAAAFSEFLESLPSDASRGPGQCFRLPPLLLQRNARAIGARGGALTKRINVDANGSIGDGGG